MIRTIYYTYNLMPYQYIIMMCYHHHLSPSYIIKIYYHHLPSISIYISSSIIIYQHLASTILTCSCLLLLAHSGLLLLVTVCLQLISCVFLPVPAPLLPLPCYCHNEPRSYIIFYHLSMT